MPVAVVGGSGFIGTRLCSRFAKSNVDFTIVDKVKSEAYPERFLQSDVTVESSLISALGDQSVVINLAAEHRDDVTPKSLYDDVNVEGARNVCRAAREKGVQKIIFTSSVAVYGFAPIGTSETGDINPFNDYGRTKYEAEVIFKEWQNEDPENRTLVIIRPTVVFGEGNRGNVYNLLRQIATGNFMMIGRGKNRKSMAYVENVAAFIEYSLGLLPGVHIYNYIDKPDFDMNTLVSHCRGILKGKRGVGVRLPYLLGLLIGYCFDAIAFVSRKKLPVSSIRVKKFCSDSVYNTAIESTDFVRPVSIETALKNTLSYEFLEDNSSKKVFFSE